MKKLKLLSRFVFTAIFAITTLFVGVDNVFATVQVHNASATISPTTTSQEQTQTYTYTITNGSTSIADIGSMKILLPTGFSTPSSVTISGGSHTWVVDGYDSPTRIIGMKALNGTNELDQNEFVSVQVTTTAPSIVKSYEWTAFIWANLNYTGSIFSLTSSQPTVTIIAKTDQTITVNTNAPASAVFGSGFGVAATASSSLPVDITTTGGCSGSGSDSATITMTSGTVDCVVHYNQVGNGSYNPAPEVTETTTANKLDLTITATGISKIHDGNTDAVVILGSEEILPGDDVTLSYTGASFDDPDVGANKNVNVTGISIGGADAGNYNLLNETTSTTANISPTAATITLDGDLNVDYDGNPHSLSASTDPEDLSNTILYNGVTTAPIAAGSYGVFAFITDPDYAGQDSDTLVINKIDQTIDFGELADKTFGDPDFDLLATASSGLPVTFTVGDEDACTISENTIHIIGVGDCNVTAHQSGDNNYNPADDVLQSFTIIKADQTITFDPLSDKTFGDPDFDVDATATSGLPVTFTVGDEDACTISENTIHITSVGSCNVTAHQGGDNNYNEAEDVSQSFEIKLVPPPTDVCSNIDGIQESIPSGMTESNGVCTTPPPRHHSSGFIRPPGQVLGASTGPSQVLGADKFIFTLFLKMGSKGDEVMELQKFLNTAGDGPLVVDGKFGPKTKAAVIKFQIANGLKGDGIVGPLTRAVLNK